MTKKSFLEKYKVLIIILIIIAVLFGWVISIYNRFVTLDQNVNGKWSEVENQYQRQADLIPNLVSTVASAVKVETKFVTDVTNARTQWQTAGNQFDKDKAGVTMNNGIAALINAVATAENYPVLQANKNYIALQDELTGTQNRIAVARGKYIESIQLYNTAIKRFPSKVFAGMFGFSEKDYYKAELNAMNNPVLGTGILP